MGPGTLPWWWWQQRNLEPNAKNPPVYQRPTPIGTYTGGNIGTGLPGSTPGNPAMSHIQGPFYSGSVYNAQQAAYASAGMGSMPSSWGAGTATVTGGCGGLSSPNVVIGFPGTVGGQQQGSVYGGEIGPPGFAPNIQGSYSYQGGGQAGYGPGPGGSYPAIGGTVIIDIPFSGSTSFTPTAPGTGYYGAGQTQTYGQFIPVQKYLQNVKTMQASVKQEAARQAMGGGAGAAAQRAAAGIGATGFNRAGQVIGIGPKGSTPSGQYMQ